MPISHTNTKPTEETKPVKTTEDIYGKIVERPPLKPEQLEGLHDDRNWSRGGSSNKNYRVQR